MSDLQENNIEFYTGDKTASLSFTSRRHITRVKKLHEKFPDQFTNYYENNDGSIFATIPLSWVKLGAPRQLSDEQKEAITERLRKVRWQND